MNRSNVFFQKILFFLAPSFWFLVGFVFATITLLSVLLIYFQLTFKDKAIPGVFIGNIDVGEKTKAEIEQLFNEKNEKISKNSLIFAYYNYEATTSAKDLHIGYDARLLATQALDVGKSGKVFTDLYMTLDAYINGFTLPFSYTMDTKVLKSSLTPIQKEIYIEPVDAQFTIENNRVTAFTQSSNGRTIDFNKVEEKAQEQLPVLINASEPLTIRLALPITVLEPKITTEEANNYGIVEVIGEGNSTYVGSIPNRAFNVAHAAGKINGVLIAPGENFSFNKAVGDVSKLTGYKEAYVIQNGRTVLGDGGGLCQVSTTLFRAILNAGLPITERHAHSYRVGYYEQNSPPGLDATVYVPTVDLKFKNDTGNHILIQTIVDPVKYSLTFILYGKKDGREVEVTKPVIAKQTAPPEPLYQDDPNLPKGQEKQVEHAAWGARIYFTRTVKKDGKVIIDDTFTTNYQPWRAVYLRGTKEG